MPTFNFDLCELPPEAQSLRAEVREFLRDALGGMASSKRALSWGGFDREFSRQLGARGWIGMMWPKKYGGHERTALERYVVLEECLSAGAPVSAHWVADRQSGPLLLRFGTEEQRQRFLPRIARGELAFAIGMSEPDSGSDLASIRTRAEHVEGGYRVNGTKIWTSNAHISDYAIALFRSKVVPDKKHEGLSQFLVDLKSPGIRIRPIIDLAGGHHFNEVHFENAFVPDDMLVGKEGEGWRQVSTELAFAIGMSEPDSGSDLASIRTRAEHVEGGYRVNGTKIWTSNAHISDYAIALFRTKVVPDKKHEGLSQFLVDLKSEGISIRPIIDLAGGHHFNEVHFQNCFVPDDMLVGKEGDGWKQVTTELAFERSGPERYLSSIRLIIELIREVGREPDERAAVVIGRLTAHLVTLRQMSLSIAGMLQAGQNPNLEAAVVKDVGTCFEQEIPEVVHALLGVEPRLGSGSQFERTFGYLVEHAPSFSLRGGTREVLRGIIARGLGLR